MLNDFISSEKPCFFEVGDVLRDLRGRVEEPKPRLKLRPGVDDVAEREERKPKQRVEERAKDLVCGDEGDPFELLQLALAEVEEAST